MAIKVSHALLGITAYEVYRSGFSRDCGEWHRRQSGIGALPYSLAQRLFFMNCQVRVIWRISTSFLISGGNGS